MRIGTLQAVHWHLIPGGVEFEDADGNFIHIHLGRDMYESLGERMTEVYVAPERPEHPLDTLPTANAILDFVIPRRVP